MYFPSHIKSPQLDMPLHHLYDGFKARTVLYLSSDQILDFVMQFLHHRKPRQNVEESYMKIPDRDIRDDSFSVKVAHYIVPEIIERGWKRDSTHTIRFRGT